MHLPFRLRCLVVVLSLSAAGLLPAAAEMSKLADFQAIAEKSRSVLVLPVYPKTADEMRAQVDQAIKDAEARLARVAAQDPKTLTFESTFAAVDAIVGEAGNADLMAGIVAQSALEQPVRDAANEANVKFTEWAVGLDYREDLYKALKAVADAKPKLDAQQQRLLDFQMRSYRRAGLALAPAERAEVEKLRKEVASLETDFAVNINQARAPLDFTAEEMAGVPQSFLDSPGVKQPDGRYRVMANITWHFQTVNSNATSAEVRHQLVIARCDLAREKNIPVLTRLVATRAEIARRLGYGSWADFQTETRMAKTGANAVKFEETLVTGLQPKFSQEMDILKQMKAKETGSADATITMWDVDYYLNKLKKERYSVDAEALRVYFPYQAVVNGMFAIYQKIFGLKFFAIDSPQVWAPGVQLYVVEDAATGVPMGAFYLDMFPRDGKFNHFACFGMKTGGVMGDGHYDLPVVALLCNFPAPSATEPSLLKHADVETLFHEFGHVMHGILARSRFVGQGAFSVPQDFVEAPSQMLENWVWDKAVLDTFAADYRDPAKKIPAETIAALVAARQATEGYIERRQLALGLLDLAMHNAPPAEAEKMDIVAVTNATLTRVALAPPPDTAFVAYFGHMAGYDAGYYGYLWAKVMAIDMASVFKAAPGGFLDPTVGRRLRDEVYGVGDTRDVGESVEKFLGRKRSQEAFLEYVGIKK